MSEKEKTISEIIVEQDHKIDLMLKYVKNIELTNKLILKEFRNNKPSGSTTNVSAVEVTPNVSSIQPAAVAPTVSSPVDEGKRVSVNQKVVFASNGKNLSLAPVEIFDSTNNLVKKARTNTSGRWSAQLFPGKYRVHIIKMGIKNKVIADMQYIINIDSSTTELSEVKV